MTTAFESLSMETLASACEFAAGMVKAQREDIDPDHSTDLEIHLKLAARRLRETDPALNKCSPIVFDVLTRLKQEHPEANIWARGHGFLDNPEVEADSPCPRCGAAMQATHAPWCERRDGTPVMASDEPLGIPEVFSRPGMEGARMSLSEWRQNALESRLTLIEDFLEIRDSAECDNCLSNRITEGLNATAEVLNNNIAQACKAIEERLTILEKENRA